VWESLANDPWPVFGVLFAAACLAAWWSRRSGSKTAFVVALVLLIAALVPLFAGLFVETPMKQVDRVVRELVAAGEARDHGRITEALDPNYDHGGYTKEELGRLIERELTNFRPDYVSLQSLVVEATPEKATASFRAATGGRYAGRGVDMQIPRYLVRLKFHFVKRDGRWRVTEIHRYDPQIEHEQEIPLAAHR
jgi:hypothetical protein